MNFEYLGLEKYGAFAALNLPIGGGEGLVVVYGPNEAGKSTCLAAISDFLFGIANNSRHGQRFGYDQMRVRATIQTGPGESQTLQRRKGRAASGTLSNNDNRQVDEAQLTAHLGATTRARFESLFGLNHHTLREGGKQLLDANGDIGRLIVEAGGGLRELLSTIAKLKEEADTLFSIRRSGSRAFYSAMDKYEAADKDAKSHLLTREAFELATAQYAASLATLEQARKVRREMLERLSKGERVLRVSPLLASLNRTIEELAIYDELPVLSATFVEDVRAAFSAHRNSSTVLKDAEERIGQIAIRVGRIVVNTELVRLKERVGQLTEAATHVAKARTDRPNRSAEQLEGEAKLEALRVAVGIPKGIVLEDRQPSLATINRVQKLCVSGTAIAPKIEFLEKQISDDSELISQLAQRQVDRKDRGQAMPYGVPLAELSSLPSFARALEVKREQAAKLQSSMTERLALLGFASVETLREFACPGVLDVQAELSSRTEEEAALAVLASEIATLASSKATTDAEIARLVGGGKIPSLAAIDGVRRSREIAWKTIRGDYLASADDEKQVVSLDQREQNSLELENRVIEADQLADHRAAEVQRVAALDLMEKQGAALSIAIPAADLARGEAESRLRERRAKWEASWDSAIRRESDLVRLKVLSEERLAILKVAETCRGLSSEIELAQAEREPTYSSLLDAEAKFGIDPASTASLSSRVKSVTQRITAHDDEYADFRRDAIVLSDTVVKLERKQELLGGLRMNLQSWREEWIRALSEIGLDEDASVQRANEVATQWMTADGILSALALTQRRISRMDEDEVNLSALATELSSAVGIVMPTDAVAVAHMVSEEFATAFKASLEYENLTSQIASFELDAEQKRRRCDSDSEALSALCTQAGCEIDRLPLVTQRVEAWLGLTKSRDLILQSLSSAGDGYSIEVLESERASRSVDEIAAEVQELKTEASRADSAIENAVASEQSQRQALEGIRTRHGVNASIAEREAAGAEIRQTLRRYLELVLTARLLTEAVERLRRTRQDPLILRAGELFALITRGDFAAVRADIDEEGSPSVVGIRRDGQAVAVDAMSDGTRDQMFLAFRISSVEHYCQNAEPIPFIADDLLVHFDDDRGKATLGLLAELGKSTQVLLFTHHRRVVEDAAQLVNEGKARVVAICEILQ